MGSYARVRKGHWVYTGFSAILMGSDWGHSKQVKAREDFEKRVRELEFDSVKLMVMQNRGYHLARIRGCMTGIVVKGGRGFKQVSWFTLESQFDLGLEEKSFWREGFMGAAARGLLDDPLLVTDAMALRGMKLPKGWRKGMAEPAWRRAQRSGHYLDDVAL